MLLYLSIYLKSIYLHCKTHLKFDPHQKSSSPLQPNAVLCQQPETLRSDKRLPTELIFLAVMDSKYVLLISCASNPSPATSDRRVKVNQHRKQAALPLTKCCH